MISERIKRLRERRLSSFSFDLFQQRAKVFTETFKELDGAPVVLKKAHALARFLREKDIYLFEDDLIAGYAQGYDYCEYLRPRDYVENHHLKFYYPVCRDFLQHDRYWEDYGNRISSIQDENFAEFLSAKAVGVYFANYGHGHVIAQYSAALEKGLASILAEAESKDQEFANASSHSSVILVRAFQEYIRRYAVKAKELAQKPENNHYFQELSRIVEGCEWISEQPPRTFFEALQLFWLVHEVITMEQPSGSLSIGRFDQFMYLFYRKDVESGALRSPEAQELIDVIWIKLNVPPEHWRVLGYQNLVVGGQTETGEDASNELSDMCLDATARLRLPQPALSVRIHEKSPEEFLLKACRVIALGGGLPALFNDDVIIKAKMRLGVSEEDAVGYGIVGCVEPAIPGREFGWTEAVRVNWAKVLELTLTNGACTVSGSKIRMPITMPVEISSFDEFYTAYRNNLIYFTELAASAINMVDKVYPEVYPVPFVSLFMEGCLEKGKDLTEGPVKYNFTAINGCGMANVADSLAVLRDAVFRKGTLGISRLREILDANYDKEGVSLSRFKNKYSKFGNDEEEVDLVMKDLCEHFSSAIRKFKNPRNGPFQSGLYTVDLHVPLGEMTGALPDGRLAGKVLANSLSPVQGMDRTSPTAVINSVTKIDHELFGNGIVLDIKMSPSVLSKPDGLVKMKDLIRTYFHLGGMEIQFNVITNDLLRKAKENPEEYRNLLVRVSGFSAFFTALEESLQNEIIERTEHQL